MDAKKKPQRLSRVEFPAELPPEFFHHSVPHNVRLAINALYQEAIRQSDKHEVCMLCLVETLSRILDDAEEQGVMKHSNAPGVVGYAALQ